MLEGLMFLFGDFWVWLGFTIVLAILMNGLSSIAAQLRRDDE